MVITDRFEVPTVILGGQQLSVFLYKPSIHAIFGLFSAFRITMIYLRTLNTSRKEGVAALSNTYQQLMDKKPEVKNNLISNTYSEQIIRGHTRYISDLFFIILRKRREFFYICFF